MHVEIEEKHTNFLKHKLTEYGDGTNKENPKKKKRNWQEDMIKNLLGKIATQEIVKKDGKIYRIMVSDEKASLKEVKQLGAKVKKIMLKEGYPETGISEERHDLYSSLFDELVRQVIIEFPELGAILIKIRNHFRQAVDNYKEAFYSSQVYGLNKIYIKDRDDRLNELELEYKNLLERQEKAAKDVEIAYQESLEKEKEYNKIGVHEEDYWSEIEFYKTYISHLLYFFDFRTEELRRKIIEQKTGVELQDDDKIEEEEEVASEVPASEKLVEEIEEEEEALPPAQGDERDIKVEGSKQKEVQIDKDLIYRENEEINVAPTESKESSVGHSALSEEEMIPVSEADYLENYQKVYNEELQYEISFSDLERGYVKKAVDAYYEAERQKEEEERKRIEQERLERERLEQELEEKKRMKHRRETLERAGIKVETEEEEIEEEVEEETEEEEEEHLDKRLEEQRARTTYSFRQTQFSMKQEEEELSLLFTDPKYKYIRRLMTPIKCKDLVDKVPRIEEAPRKKMKTIIIKKPKIKGKGVKKAITTEQASDQGPSEGVKGIKMGEFKWGLTLSMILAMGGDILGRLSLIDKVEERPEEDDKEAEEKIEKLQEEVSLGGKEEESMLYSSGMTVGKTESIHSSDGEPTASLSLEEEEEKPKKMEKQKDEEQKPEEEEEVVEEEEEECINYF